MDGTDGADGTRARGRATVAAELAELRRHLADVPPHHGGGTRGALEDRLRRLEAELARIERREGTR